MQLYLQREIWQKPKPGICFKNFKLEFGADTGLFQFMNENKIYFYSSAM